MKLIFFIIASFLLFSFKINNENDVSSKFYQDIEKIYLQKNVLSYLYTVIQYDSTGKNLLKELKGEIYQSKSKYSYDLDNVKVAFDDSFYILVYPERKEILYHIVTDKLMKQTQKFDIQDFVKQLKNNKIKVLLDSCNDDKHYCYNLVYGNLDKDLYKIKIDKKTGYIDYLRIDYYGSDEKHQANNFVIELKYSDYKIVDIEKFHPLDEYVIKKNGELFLNKKYKDYQIKRF